MKIDITERTVKLAIEIIKLSERLPRSPAGFAVAHQLVRSGTSIGANIQEAQDSISKKEFTRKMNIALKEAKETSFWLEIICKSEMIQDRDLAKILLEIKNYPLSI